MLGDSDVSSNLCLELLAPTVSKPDYISLGGIAAAFTTIAGHLDLPSNLRPMIIEHCAWCLRPVGRVPCSS